jgi:hypothetical protein
MKRQPALRLIGRAAAISAAAFALYLADGAADAQAAQPRRVALAHRVR